MKQKILYSLLAAFILLSALSFNVSADFDVNEEIKSVILIEPTTGTVLFERNPDERLSPASVTKVMTALLVMEAIEDGKLGFDDTITVSANASAMGGSQIFLEIGEKISVNELLKGMMVASGNDAAVAFAETLGGTTESFVDMMNAKAEELGLLNTHFMNCHGLDEEEHYTSARDIAIMSAELLKHEKILEFTSIWTDSIRGGKTSLANTNKLVRFYEGCDGLKTGSTSIAKCCISATAKRNNMRLIAVVMAAPTTDLRFGAVRQMFDYGFALKEVAVIEEKEIGTIHVTGGEKTDVKLCTVGASMLIDKGTGSKIVYETVIEESIAAPVLENQVVGKIKATYNGEELFSCDVVTSESVERVSFLHIFRALILSISKRN